MSSSSLRRLHGIFADKLKLTGKTVNETVELKLKASKRTKTKSKIPKKQEPETIAESLKKSSESKIVELKAIKRTKPTSQIPRKPEPETIVESFKKSSESPSFRSRYGNYEAAVRRLSNGNHFSAIEDIFEHQKQYPDISNEYFVTRLILLYGKAKMYDHARKLFDEMPNLNCQRTVFSFNALLEACIRSLKYDEAIELFRELPKELSFEPDLVSYNTAIKALCKAGSLDSAVAMMDEMENCEIKPDRVTFNTLLDAFYESKRFSEAEDLWGLMQKKDIVVDLGSYNMRFRGLVRENQVGEAIELFEQMGKNDIKPNAFSYNAIIKIFVNDESLEQGKSWYEKMVNDGYYPDNATFGMLINFACEKGDFDFAFELCKKAMDSKVSLHSSTMQRVVDSLAEHSKIEDAKELVNLSKSYKRFRYRLSKPVNP